MVSAAFFPKGKQNFSNTHSLSSAISVLKKSPYILANTYKKHQKKWHEACSTMSLGRIVQNIVSSQYLVPEP